MCKLKSAIILKDRVFVPDYDSHSEMLEELGIKDTWENAERLFVRAELSPRSGDVFSSVDEWCFTVDQDICPDWFVEEYEKQRMVDAVKVWAKDHIHIGVDGLSIGTGSNHYIKDCKDVIIRDNATVKNICDNAMVKNICDNATVQYICDNATVEYICGNVTVEHISGDAMIIGSPYGWRNKDKIILSDNSTFKDRESKIIYQAGDWELRLINKSN